MKMKAKVAALTLLIAGSALARVGVVVGFGWGVPVVPPPVVAYAPPPAVAYAPGPAYAPPVYAGFGYAWVPGYYYPLGARWAWRAGYWAPRPWAGAAWIAPRWTGGRWYAGHWRR
jgi:hypothetical protein